MDSVIKKSDINSLKKYEKKGPSFAHFAHPALFKVYKRLKIRVLRRAHVPTLALRMRLSAPEMNFTGKRVRLFRALTDLPGDAIAVSLQKYRPPLVFYLIFTVRFKQIVSIIL